MRLTNRLNRRRLVPRGCIPLRSHPSLARPEELRLPNGFVKEPDESPPNGDVAVPEVTPGNGNVGNPEPKLPRGLVEEAEEVAGAEGDAGLADGLLPDADVPAFWTTNCAPSGIS